MKILHPHFTRNFQYGMLMLTLKVPLGVGYLCEKQ